MSDNKIEKKRGIDFENETSLNKWLKLKARKDFGLRQIDVAKKMKHPQP